MSEYQEILEKIQRQETMEYALAGVMVLIALALVWGAPYVYYSRMKKNRRKSYERKQKERRTSLLAQLALTAILVLFAGVIGWSFGDTCYGIQRDIEECAYESYVGEFWLEPNIARARGRLYDRHQCVSLTDGEFVFLYMDDCGEYLNTTAGAYTGKLIYGRHSQYVVSIELDE